MSSQEYEDTVRDLLQVEFDNQVSPDNAPEGIATTKRRLRLRKSVLDGLFSTRVERT